MDTQILTDKIRKKAIALGFQDIGFSRAAQLDDEAKKLEKWLKNGYQGEMSYMNNHFDLRIDPTKLLPGTQTVISLTHSYFPPQKLQHLPRPKVAKYAYGKDYHKVLKKKCNLLIDFMREQIGDIQARAYVDSAPILERSWAQRSGIGWVGKNSLLLTKSKGSFFFLAEILVDIPLNYSTEIATDYCKNCTKCIDACPTQAIVASQVVDARKCISYLTIEYKKELPLWAKDKMENWAFGCDICQDVCPINARSIPHTEPRFLPSEDFTNLSTQDMQDMTEDMFEKIFAGTAIKRTKYQGWIRNNLFLKN